MVRVARAASQLFDPVAIGVTLAACVALGAVLVSIYVGAQTTPLAGQLATVQHSQHQLAVSHLWLEEAIAGDPHIEVDADVLTRIDAADDALRQLLSGGTTDAGLSLDPVADPVIRRELEQVRADLARWRAMAQERWTSRASRGTIGGDLDQAYDAVFEANAARLETVTFALGVAVSESQSRVETLSWSVVLVLVAAFLGLLAITVRHQRALTAERDLLERRVAERTSELAEQTVRAESANVAKTSFLANMSHEIRTPMTAVIGMTQLLQDTPLDAVQREYVETSLTSAHQLLALINDVLDLSKLEAGALDLESAPFLVSELIEEALEIGGHGARSKSVDLVADVEANVPDTVVGDSRRLRQVVVNLVSNACKFTDDGHVVVRCSLAEARDPRRVGLRFEVTDTGIGIAPDRLDRLFKRFTQVDAGTNRKYGGTGLGLVISRELVHQMRGEITVRSELGRGTTFAFHVELERAPESLVNLRARAELRGKRVLVIDDNPTNRRVFGRFLAKWGAEHEAVVSAKEGLAALEATKFDAILLDYHMPEVDGLAAARLIRDRWADVPIVLLSSLVVKAEDGRGLLDATLTKPVREARLFDVLLSVFGALAPIEGPAREKLGERHALKILVAEDQPVNRLLISALLRRHGFATFDVVEDGQQAIDACRAVRYDLVLMDVQMPRVDGLEAARTIVAEQTADRRPRIVAMTANVFVDDRRACTDAGMSGFVAKPIVEAELVDEIRRTIGRRNPSSQDARTRPVVRDEFLDRLVVAQLQGLGVLRDFVEGSGRLRDDVFGALRMAAESGEAANVARHAHSLKGSVGTLGATKLSARFSDVEQAARRGEVPDAALLAALDEQLVRLTRELRAAALQ